MKRLSSEIEERLPGVFEPNTILPVQFFTRLQRSSAWTGEQRLMAAVLEDAVAVCSRANVPRASKARHVLRESLRWLRSNDRAWMFSFLRICETLDLDPAAIRRGIRVLRGEESPTARVTTLAPAHVVATQSAAEFELPKHAAAG
jgi:hypothetical protein